MSRAKSDTDDRITELPFTPPRASVTLASLLGLRAAGVAAGIKPSGRPDVALLVTRSPYACAGVFTRNAFCAAPVEVSREHLSRTGGRFRALILNSGNANACTGARGTADARAMCQRVAALVGCAVEEVLVASTGVIGVPLPINRVLSGIDQAYADLQSGDGASRRFLDAMQTTDAFPKEAGESVAAHDFAVAGVAKGAGMIEPDMATMIAIVGTSCAIEPGALGSAVAAIARGSFNAIHVDSHASTNDSFFLFSTGGKAAPEDHWRPALERTCHRLAWLIARDGEGATKVTTIDVVGAATEAGAQDVARRIAHSALVRTALFGNDPNWGRFVSAAGNSPFVRDASRLSCSLQGVVVFRDGAPTDFDRTTLAAAMDADDVRLVIDLGAGEAAARVLSSDLGYRYIEVNAEYTT